MTPLRNARNALMIYRSSLPWSSQDDNQLSNVRSHASFKILTHKLLVLKNQASALCFSKMRKNEASSTQQVILCLATNSTLGKYKFSHTITPKIENHSSSIHQY